MRSVHSTQPKHKDTPATRRAVNAIIDKYGLRELTEKQEAFLDLIGCKPTFERHLVSALAAAIKRDTAGHVANDPNRIGYKIADEIHIAAGIPRHVIEHKNAQRNPPRQTNRLIATKWE